jgi:hypothetical protein
MEASMTQEFRTARRDFLKRAGRFAVVTPPTMVLLLSATGHNYARAASGFVTPFEANVRNGVNQAPGLIGTGRGVP